MWDDPIVAEVRLNREKLAAKFGYDVRAIFDDLRQRQGSFGGKLISPKPRVMLPATESIPSAPTDLGTTVSIPATSHEQFDSDRVCKS